MKHAALIYGSFACGVLAKGPIALLLPTAVLGTYLLMAHRQTDSLRNKNVLQRIRRWPGYFVWTCWRMRPLTAMAMLLVIAVPWYLWVGFRTDGKFLWDFFIEHNLHRAQRPMEGHDGPIFYYLIAALPGFFPWSVFLVPTIGNTVFVLRRRQSVAPAVTFCCAWIVVWITAFSLASTKLPSYITPCYPAMALLTGFFLDRWVAGRVEVAPVWPRLAIATLGLAGIVML
jgi:4-amino-4-deoxy-L-arabinose transferase-like glycosyltransferase